MHRYCGLSTTIALGVSIDQSRPKGLSLLGITRLNHRTDHLKDLGIIPRSPMPALLEERDPANMTREELVELARCCQVHLPWLEATHPSWSSIIDSHAYQTDTGQSFTRSGCGEGRDKGRECQNPEEICMLCHVGDLVSVQNIGRIGQWGRTISRVSLPFTKS